MNTQTSPHDRRPPASIRLWVAFLTFAMVAGFFLFTEHRAHLLGALPYLIFLLCPLAHLFMHRGHDGHGGHHES